MLRQKLTFTHRWSSHQGQLGVQYFAQGHFDMQPGGAGVILTLHAPYLHHRCKFSAGSTHELIESIRLSFACELRVTHNSSQLLACPSEDGTPRGEGYTTLSHCSLSAGQEELAQHVPVLLFRLETWYIPP